MTRKRLSAAAIALALAAPSSALAQSAGDDQYEDPFGDQAPPSATPEPSQPASPATGSEDAPAAPEAAAPAPSEPAPAAPAAAPAAQVELPRTGAETWLQGAGGLLLVIGGSVLRLRLGHAGRRA
jgi:LPXTG-motif cell wall-anchored protein